MGYFGEYFAKTMINTNTNLQLLTCGIQTIGIGKKKDIDLIWADNTNKIIYYRELKGNMNLDTEKLPATYTKMTNIILPFIKEKYPDYEIDVGILYWTVYNLDTECKSKIKKCIQNKIKVDDWATFCKLINFEWEQNDYYEYMRDIGKHIKINNS